jgi:hypothetical protein
LDPGVGNPELTAEAVESGKTGVQMTREPVTQEPG